jgi:hypothetical protein
MPLFILLFYFYKNSKVKKVADVTTKSGFNVNVKVI